jgi:hypothetical protein
MRDNFPKILYVSILYVIMIQLEFVCNSQYKNLEIKTCVEGEKNSNYISENHFSFPEFLGPTYSGTGE